MPQEVGKRTFVLEHSYDMQLVIGDKDYSSDLRRIQIVNNLAGGYPVITMDLSLDPDDVILNRIYGKEPMKLTFRLIGRSQAKVPLEEVEMELMYLKSSNPVPQKSKSSQDSFRDRVIISFATVCSKPFKTMTTTINDVFTNSTVGEIISKLVSRNTTAELVYDKEGENTNRIEQIIIPPKTLFNTIRYLDDTFGIYEKGASNLGYCQYDNKLYITNLSKKINKNQTFSIYHLSTDSEDQYKDIIEKSADGKTFYTYQPIKSAFSGNTQFAATASKIEKILKPNNQLFQKVAFQLEDIAKQFGAVFKNDKIDYNNELKNRKSYVTMETGFDAAGKAIVSIAKMVRDIIGLATVEFNLEKNLPILKLIQVGEPIKLNVKTFEYSDLGGMYLLKASRLTFIRKTSDWISVARLIMMRTNKTI